MKTKNIFLMKNARVSLKNMWKTNIGITAICLTFATAVTSGLLFVNSQVFIANKVFYSSIFMSSILMAFPLTAYVNLFFPTSFHWTVNFFTFFFSSTWFAYYFDNPIASSLQSLVIMLSLKLIYALLVIPLVLNLITLSLRTSQNQKIKIHHLFKNFNVFNAAAAFLLTLLYTFLWSLLFIIPGIVASYSYVMVFYIMADDKSLSAKNAIKESKRIMYGNKWKFFTLQLRFLGWFVLSILTFGILFLWLMPYMHISIANFYRDIKNMPAMSTGPTDQNN